MKLKRMFEVLFKKLWLLILIPLVFVAIVSYITMYQIEPIYETDAMIYIVDKLDEPDARLTYDHMMVNQQMTRDYRELLKSRMMVNEIIKQEELDLSADQILSNMNVVMQGDANIIKVTYKDTDAKRASEVVNSLARVFERKISSLLGVHNIEVIDLAHTPESPIYPSQTVNAALAIIGGLVIAVCIVLLLDYLDEKIKSVNDLKEIDTKVIGVLPKLNLS